jgi:hypothetical protein
MLVWAAAMARCTSQSQTDAGADASVDVGGSDVVMEAGMDAGACSIAPPYPSLETPCDATAPQACLTQTGVVCLQNPPDCDSGLFVFCPYMQGKFCGGNACCLNMGAQIEAGCPESVTLMPGMMMAASCGPPMGCPAPQVELCTQASDCKTGTCVPALFAGTTNKFGICQ